MVVWPRACIGCAESNPSKLKEFKYTRRKNLSQNSQDMARNRQPYFYVQSLTYLCKNCLQKARNTFLVRTILSIVGFFVGGYLTFDFDLPTSVNILGFLMMIISIPFFVLTVVLRRQFPNFYWKFKVKNRERPIFNFKNPKYTQIFVQANPNLAVKGLK